MTFAYGIHPWNFWVRVGRLLLRWDRFPREPFFSERLGLAGWNWRGWWGRFQVRWGGVINALGCDSEWCVDRESHSIACPASYDELHEILRRIKPADARRKE